jgi:RNA polymerase sigma-70 factor (ECF subfamily)
MERPEISCLSSEELASQARAGSEDCFAELVRRHYGSLFSFLYRKVSNRHDAEDLSQETFARAYQRLHQYQPRYKFATWLFTIGWRLACSFYRSRDASVDVPAEKVCVEAEDKSLLATDEREDLWEKIGVFLPANQGTVLWYRYGEGMTISEIAEKTGKTEIHVKVMLHRARVKLAKCLGKNDRTGGSK